MAGRKWVACALWIVQGLLALTFLYAGGMKLVLPIEEMTKAVPLPGPVATGAEPLLVVGAMAGG